MKCPVCGYPKRAFVVSREKLWKGRSELTSRERAEPRKDFRLKPCPKCGDKTEVYPNEVQETEA